MCRARDKVLSGRRFLSWSPIYANGIICRTCPTDFSASTIISDDFIKLARRVIGIWWLIAPLILRIRYGRQEFNAFPIILAVLTNAWHNAMLSSSSIFLPFPELWKTESSHLRDAIHERSSSRYERMLKDFVRLLFSSEYQTWSLWPFGPGFVFRMIFNVALAAG